jgi:outer membrane biosynthesis protein TonB
MPITQIPFQDPPVAPPEKSQPEQLDLYATRDWEAAYRELDSRVPHLLIQLQDDLTRARRREAAWISLVAHLLLFIMLWQMNLIEKYVPWHHAVAVPLHPGKDDNLTFLTLPSDLQKSPRPDTNIASDKDRTAMSRHPNLNKVPHRMVAPPPGAPGMSVPRPAQPAAQPQVQAQNQAPAQQQAQPPAPRPQFDTNQQAKLQTPQANNARSVFDKYAGGQSAGSAIQEATQDVAANRVSGGGQGGGYGLDTGEHGQMLGPYEVLSDTRGVDFGPYLRRILEDIRGNWYHLVPPSVEMKKGKLAIQFAINKDGSLGYIKMVATSNDVALDRAAWGGITTSNPFPPLPTEFTGPNLELLIRFYYNPDKGEME